MSSSVLPASSDPAATAEASWMVGQYARRLTRHYALLLGAVAVPLLLLVIALALQQLAGQRRAMLEELAGQAHAERAALEPVIGAAVRHVAGLREFAQDRLTGRLPQAESPLRAQLAPFRHGNGMTGIHLDAFVGSPVADRLGNVIGDLPLLERSPAAMAELDQALDMFAPMRLAHVAAPQLRWSYYLSAQGDFMTMFPFAPSADFVDLGGYPSMGELIRGWLGYEVFAGGTPARNPDRAPYWTGVYEDAGGAGPMVSHAAPVYAGDRFLGVVGTDILLSYLDAFLDGIAWPVGRVLIVNDHGQVLAASRADGGQTASGETGALPRALVSRPLAELTGGPTGFRRLAGHEVLAERLTDAPFSLLVVVPEWDLVRAILPRFKPYALILAGLMLALLVAHALLQRRFVRPALRLVRHIQDESDGRPGAPTNVPALWRPWFEAVSRAFAAGRDYQTRLAASEARLKAAAESIPDGVAIFDAEDRLAFVNSRYPGHLTESARATMALGKRWRDWAREAEALGPIYHPEMGADYLAQRDADRGDGSVDREHRLSDGRWVRVRESRMPDGGRVLLTTDTTLERRDRQERALVATAMAQVGDSIEITDADYRLLYVNPAFTALTGYTAEEALGRTPGDLLRSGQHPPEFYAEIDRVVRGGEVWKGRIVSRHKDGHLVHSDATISPVHGDNGEFLHFVAAKRDAGERMRAEAALEESRKAHAAVLEAALDCFVSIDEHGRILEFNPAAERTFGYTLAEVQGQLLHELLTPPALRAAHQAGMARYLATGAARILGRRLELTALRKDGAVIPVELVVAETRHADRPAFMAYMRDLSEQKRTEAALRASEARFLAAAASIPDGLVILDDEDRIVFYNNRHPELLPPALRDGLALGIRFEDWIREGIARGPVYHPDMGPDYATRRLATRGGPLTEREHKHVDGRWVRIREARMPDGGRVLLTTDITDRREAETRFLAAAESIPDGLAIFDAEDRFVFFNSRYPAHLTENLREVLRIGMRFEDWLKAGVALGPIYHPDMGPDYLERRLALREQGEHEFEHKVVDGRWIRIRESRMADGGRVLLTSDVTERRRRQQQLSLLAMAVDQVGDAVEITDAQGRFTYVNPAFERLTGFARADVLGQSWEILAGEQKDEEFYGAIARRMNEGGTWQGRLAHQRKDGETSSLDATISPLRDARGRITHYVAVKRDVTEQERAAAALRASEASYRALVETQTEFVLRLLPDGRLTFVNEAYCRYVGKPREELLHGGWNDLEAVAPGDRERYEQHLRALTPDRPTASIEIRAQIPDGSERWEHWVDTGLFDEDGRLVEIQSVGRDVTERKRSELALRESEARYRALVETQTEFVLRQLPEGHLTFVNEAYCRYVGKPREYLVSAEFNGLDMMVPEDRSRFDAHLRSLSPERPTAVMETRAILPDGSLRWERWVDTGIFDSSGKLLELQSTGRDITDQKNSELALRESEARFRAVVEGQTEFILRLDADGYLTFVNDAYCRYRGLDRAVMLGGFNDIAHYPLEQQEHVRAAWARLTPQAPSVTYELVKPCDGGGECWEEWTDTGIFAPDGHLVEIQAIGRDVTERKVAERSLRDSEARFRLIAESVPLPIAITAVDRYAVLFINAMGREVFGVEAGTTDRHEIERIWAGLDQRAQVARRIEQEGKVEQAEVRMRRGDGTEFDAILSARPLRYGGERAVLGVITDITERSRMEDALRESEARLTALMDNAPLVIHLKDRAGRYLLANPESAKIFGRDPKQVIGRTAAEIFPPKEAEFIERHHQEVLSTGRTLFYEEHQPSLDAYQWSIVIRFPIRDAHGEVVVVGCLALDISERKRAEAALKASEARLAAFMENAPVGMYLKDLSGRYLMANPEMGKLFGRPVETMIGRMAEAAFPPAEAERIRRHNLEVIETGRPLVTEEALAGRSEYAWSMIIRFPIRDETGSIVQVGGFNLDITRSKLAEAEVKASAERFRTIAEVHPTPMVIVRLADRALLFANRAFFDTFLVEPDAMAGFDRSTLYGDPADREAIFAELARGERIDGRELVMRKSKGGLFTSVLTARCIDYEGSEAAAMSYLDVEDLKRAEAALRASEQRFRGIAEAHPMPLVIVRRRDGRLLFANEPFRMLFGMGDADLDAVAPEQLYASEEGRARFLAAIAADGAVDGLEQELRRLDGGTFPAATTSRLVEYEGEPAFVTSVVDLTEQRAAEAEIQRQRETLHQSEKLAALGALLAGVAHELNNPLSVVVGYSSMLRELAQDDASRQRATRVHAAAERCARIVKTFLAMARSRPPQYGPVRLGEVAENALELAGYGLRTADIEIVREFPADLPLVWGDSDQLHQVLTNLIVNAQQALLQVAPPRRLRLRIGEERGQLVIEVEDNGPGMAEEVRKRIFEPFFTTKPQGVGTGVGLSVCLGIVTAHGGRIEVDSEPGRGTRFAVILPLPEAQPSLAPAAVPIATLPARGHVLVVDDEPEIAELVAEHLRRDGLTVEVVGSGAKALLRLQAERFDVVVSDLRMPDLDGPSLVAALRERHPELARKVVLITGDALGAGFNQAIRDADLPVLEKPLDIAALRGEVRRLLDAA